MKNVKLLGRGNRTGSSMQSVVYRLWCERCGQGSGIGGTDYPN